MPTYEYACTLCLHEWEVEQSIKDPPVDVCPRCGDRTAQRQVSGGTGFLLGGGGWARDGYAGSATGGGRP